MKSRLTHRWFEWTFIGGLYDMDSYGSIQIDSGHSWRKTKVGSPKRLKALPPVRELNCKMNVDMFSSVWNCPTLLKTRWTQHWEKPQGSDCPPNRVGNMYWVCITLLNVVRSFCGLWKYNPMYMLNHVMYICLDWRLL